jgi:hypothetical protein
MSRDDGQVPVYFSNLPNLPSASTKPHGTVSQTTVMHQYNKSRVANKFVASLPLYEALDITRDVAVSCSTCSTVQEP